MSKIALNDADIASFQALGEVLIPGSPSMPAPSALPVYEGLLRRAVRACGHSDAQIRRALDAIPLDVDWQSAKTFAVEDTQAFAVASEIVSAAYFMAPQVLAGLDYPVERRHPAGLEEFADEYGSGVFERILELEPLYRDSR